MIDSREALELKQYWDAANYLSACQIYLLDNPLLKRPLEARDIKPRLLGHWGTTPGLNLVYVHLNRIIKKHDLNILYVAGPGHGGPGLVANTYLEGSYSEIYPKISCDEDGMKQLFRQFSFPGGIPSHAAAHTPGSIHEGGELGYSLAHAFGAVFDNPSLIACCVVGDGEAETGALAASWHSNKFLNLKTDGVVLPVLHLNGYKIANPTLLARISQGELEQLFSGYGYRPYFLEETDPDSIQAELAEVMDSMFAEIHKIKEQASQDFVQVRPRLPMLILKTPKGWTGPKFAAGLPVEGTWRAHQLPLEHPGSDREQLSELESWLRSYHPEQLFDPQGRLIERLRRLAPAGNRRMGANPHANGGMLLKDLILPDFKQFQVELESPGAKKAEATRILGGFLRDVMKLNRVEQNFRIVGPDETASNRLEAVYEETGKRWLATTLETDMNLSADGRVMEVLSEHLCEGWLEGYLLTGRHGLFSCYEAFIQIVDSMFNQHAKWLKTAATLHWRRPIASLNYLLTSHVWRQDHNGDSHQDPGFLDHIANKTAQIVRIYLPPDANTLLSTCDHCLRSKNYVNVIVAGKQPEHQWLSMAEATTHCTAGLGIWPWASNDEDAEPDVVIAAAGDVPTLEALAATDLLRKSLPKLKIRFINVVDLMTLQPHTEHPHGLTDAEFDGLFTTSKPIIFAFHGYALLIHRLTYRRANHASLHVRGYKGEGTTTTPFEMVVMNELDRFHLAQDVLDRVPGLGSKGAYLRQSIKSKLAENAAHAALYGDDLPEIKNWKWS